MKQMIFQVYIPIRGKNKLYDYCTNSVREYCKLHGIEYYQLTEPKLKILPNMDRTNRNKNGLMKEAGYLPIFEKEYAFTVMKDKAIAQCAIVDADIYIRPNSPNIFNEVPLEYSFGGVLERDLPLSKGHKNKITGYSRDMFKNNKRFDWKDGIADFYNMGMMVCNESLLDYLKGQSPSEFIYRDEFRDFVDGIGLYKWSTDQVLLNHWIKNENIKAKNMDWRWNGMYKGVDDSRIKEAHFVHFFLKDKLPARGENVEELMKHVK